MVEEANAARLGRLSAERRTDQNGVRGNGRDASDGSQKYDVSLACLTSQEAKPGRQIGYE